MLDVIVRIEGRSFQKLCIENEEVEKSEIYQKKKKTTKKKLFVKRKRKNCITNGAEGETACICNEIQNMY